MTFEEKQAEQKKLLAAIGRRLPELKEPPNPMPGGYSPKLIRNA